MTYKSDKQYTQDLIILYCLSTIVTEGMDYINKDHMALLEQICADLGLPTDREDKLMRRAKKVVQKLVDPFIEAEAPVAKFALAFYYVMRELIDEDRLQIVEGSPLDKFCEQLLSDDGSLTELANVDKVDKSAQKAGKRMLKVLKREGYFG